MASTAININATNQNGKSVRKSVPNVNPAATSEQLVAFGQMVSAVSNNTYGGTTRIDKTDCDTEQTPSGLGKIATQVSITLNSDSFSASEVAEAIYDSYFELGSVATDRSESDETNFAVYINTGAAQSVWLAGRVGENTLYLSKADSAPPIEELVAGGMDVTIVALENDTYAAGSATCHVAFTA